MALAAIKKHNGQGGMLSPVIHLFIKLIILNIIYGVVIYVLRNIQVVNILLIRIKGVVIGLESIAVG